MSSPADSADSVVDDADAYRPLNPVRIALALSAVALGIVVVAFATLTAHQRTTGIVSQNWHTVFWYFDVGREYNMATWFASGLWLLLGALTAIIASTRPRHRWSWWLFSVVALLASVDEYLELHERLDIPGARLAEMLPFDASFTWVIAGAPIALVVALLLLRLWLALPRRSQVGIALGGVLFLAGAIGVETVNGQTLAANEWVVTDAYIYGTMIEEFLEMVGVATAFAAVAGVVQRDTVRGGVRLDPVVSGRAPVGLPRG